MRPAPTGRRPLLAVVLSAMLSAALPPWAAAAQSTWFLEATAHQHRMRGRFSNLDYGFSIAVPPGVAGYVTDGGDANHGISLILGERRSIVVYPAYLVADDGDDLPCRRGSFPWPDRAAGRVGPARLGGRRACAVSHAGAGTVWRVLEMRGTGRAAGIKYTLLLTTTPRQARADAAVLRTVASSFRRVPITP